MSALLNILKSKTSEIKNPFNRLNIIQQGLSGAAYEPINIKKLGNDTWEVDLKMRLTEFKNNQAVKDVEIIYPLKITRTNVSPQTILMGWCWLGLCPNLSA